ncbi:class I SAM-dependent methyltransferase [Gimesia sp.]|uniref:class I SAM-dependent methyltransferase n=1 Tax=Gimesia sp. TaxID=2024833 RepID=UPI0032EC1755
MSTTDEKLTKSFYDRISHSYDALADSNEHVAREKGLAALAVSEGETVLEIGYGTGHSLVALAEAVGESGQVCGVDISDGMQKVSEKRVAEAGLADRVKLSVANTPPLPFEDNTFDAVSMSFTLELFPLVTIPEVLQEIRRVLKPGGRLGVVSMALTQAGEKDSILEKTYKWMHQHFPHIVDCQPIDAIGYLKESGFEIKEENNLEIWTMPVAVLVGVSPA